MILEGSTLVWAVVVCVLGTARLARLLVFDDYPPMMWVRIKYLSLLPEGSAWGKLAECAFCASPYIAAADIAAGYFSDFHWTWWVFNIWLSVSYIAAIVVAYDQPE